MTKLRGRWANVFILIIILIFSLVGGLFGTWLLKGQTNLTPATNEINLGDGLSSQARVLIRDPRKVVVNQDLKVQDLVLSTRESSVYFFRQKTIDQTKQGIDITKAYDLSQPDFLGLALTADGWVLLPTSEGFNLKSLMADYRAVDKNKKIYSVDQAVNYPGSNLSLVHLANVNNLLVKNLVGSNDSQVGQTVLAVNAAGDAWLSYVSAWRPTAGISRVSDELSWQAELMNEIPSSFKNSWLFNMSGDLLALIDARGQLQPTLNFRSSINNYLKNHNFNHPYLGVNYFDLSRLAKNEGIGQNSSLNLSGALLSPEGNHPAVAKNSPAQKAGLQANDIIIAVSGTELNEFNDLATIIQGYKPGDEVTLKFWRQGEVKDVDVILGEQK